MDSPMPNTPKWRLWKIPFVQLLAQLPPIIRRIATYISQCGWLPSASTLYAKSNIRVCAFPRASIRAWIHAIIGADGTRIAGIAPRWRVRANPTDAVHPLRVVNSDLIPRELKVSSAHGPTCVLIVIGCEPAAFRLVPRGRGMHRVYVRVEPRDTFSFHSNRYATRNRWVAIFISHDFYFSRRCNSRLTSIAYRVFRVSLHRRSWFRPAVFRDTRTRRMALTSVAREHKCRKNQDATKLRSGESAFILLEVG